MSRSRVKFKRWQPLGKSTWPYRIFLKFNGELHQLINTHLVSTAAVYRGLKEKGANWNDSPAKFFDPKHRDFEMYKNLREWSDTYNMFDNWVTLSRIMTISSTIETYLASVIGSALDSDPGVLLGIPRGIDGAAVLKNGPRKGIDSAPFIEACTKGTWSARLDAFEKLFGVGPPELRSAHSSFEAIRGIRNRFGHAFGRDIDEARKHGVLELLPMEKVSQEQANRLWKDVSIAMKAVDVFLLTKHIGDFETVRFYHTLEPTLKVSSHRNVKAVALKRAIGGIGAESRGKDYCGELIDYWEAL
jgi:hypothetical protein